MLLGVLLLAATGQPADAELHTFHCLSGCPIGAPATNDTVVREIYTLSSNDLTKMADWVAYRVTPETIAPSRDDRNYRADPALGPSETLAESHYAGAPAALRIDHGHQAPLAAFSRTPHWDDTNYNSNMTPQASALNQGPWQRLEGRERELASTQAVYVLTGPLFERYMRPMPAAPQLHRVPSGYWKVIALADGRMSAFIMDQNTPGTRTTATTGSSCSRYSCAADCACSPCGPAGPRAHWTFRSDAPRRRPSRPRPERSRRGSRMSRLHRSCRPVARKPRDPVLRSCTGAPEAPGPQG
jgi:endonuclease G, mitochondrial